MKNIHEILLLLTLIPNVIHAQITSEIETNLVFVEGGDYYMGCTNDLNSTCISDDKPSVYVQLYDFWIGKYEVTNSQFAVFLTQSGNQHAGGEAWYKMDKYALIKQLKDGTFTTLNGFEDYPVTNVSWYGAIAYTEWLSEITKKLYRLPTEAEWEFAARGGKKSQGYLYSGSNTAEEVGWLGDFAAASNTGWDFKNDKGTHPVGRKTANELGLFYMTGNVSEWCTDVYENTYEGEINPAGPTRVSLRVLRGGSWDNKASDCRVSARNFAQHVNRWSVNKGFRVVMEKDISSEINAFAKEKGFSGTILVKKKNQTLYHQSFGMANREERIANSNETPYFLASITKLFTSVIILQLVDEGKLDLQKEIASYLPDYPGPLKDKVNIHQLFTHTSGIENCEASRTEGRPLPDVYLVEVTSDELLKRFCSGNQQKVPDTTFNYNNADYIILGKIIERITGETYQRNLQRRILDPLKMDQTGLITKSSMTKKLAQGYKWNRNSKDFEKDPDRLFQNYYASGAMYSTASNLVLFSDALYYHKLLLTEKSLSLLLQTYPETKNYGYGLWITYPKYNHTVSKVAQRFGRIWGINTLLSHFTDHDITVIILANTNKVNVDEIQDMVGELLMN